MSTGLTARRSQLGYALLFVPYAAAYVVENNPTLSYLLAWGGSWYILWLTLSGRVRPLPDDMPWREQLIRPFVLTQLVFAGYTCLTSIFYFLYLKGYGAFQVASPLFYIPTGELERVAAAQRCYVLGHAGIAAAMIALADYRDSGRWRLASPFPLPTFLLGLTAIMTVVGPAISVLDWHLGQVVIRSQQIALVASVLALAAALPTRHLGPALLGVGLFSYNVMRAVLSGWKEDVIVVLLLLAVFLYPTYRRTVMVATPVVMAFLFFVLPAFTYSFRNANWTKRQSAGSAATMAAQQVRSDANYVRSYSLFFLSRRASEISLFTHYLQNTPSRLPFYGTRLAEQAVELLVPRAFWAGKPDVERLVMQRVYANRVVSPASKVSAKPQYFVDGYLSAGAVGVLVAGLVFGALAMFASRLAERWFGGYLMGSGLVFTSLFMVFWRGNSFEFFFNTVVWSFASMGVLFFLGRATGWIVPATRPHRVPPVVRRSG